LQPFAGFSAYRELTPQFSNLSCSHFCHRPTDFAYSVGDRLIGNDLWLIIELESDDRGLRTSLGKAVNEHVCAGVRAAQNVGWTPLVVGAK